MKTVSLWIHDVKTCSAVADMLLRLNWTELFTTTESTTTTNVVFQFVDGDDS